MHLKIKSVRTGLQLLAAFSALFLLVACSGPDPDPPAPGSDRDEHGCIPSAGYSWCERTSQCERPWELAEQHGFENTSEAFKRFCSAEQQAD